MPVLVKEGGTVEGRMLWWCAGCESLHLVTVAPHAHPWGWNGSMEAPTFTPSILTTLGPGVAGGADRKCHVYITDGRVQYLADSWHHLAGQTVPLPPLPFDPT